MLHFKRNKTAMVIKPNIKLYLAIIVGAIVVVLLSLAIPTECPLFAIATGIGCGMLASVIVAWLIDRANCKKQAEDVKRKQELIFNEYKSSVERLRLRIAHTAKLRANDDGKHTLREWLEILLDINLYSNNENPESSRASTYQMIVNQLDMLQPSLESLIKQYPLLVEADIVNDSKFYDCIDVQISACEEAKNFCESPKARIDCEYINDAVCLLVEEYIKYFKPENMHEQYASSM